jgi:chaperonin GroES
MLEKNYIQSLKNLLNKGIKSSDRTGVGTLRLIEAPVFNIKENIVPILRGKFISMNKKANSKAENKVLGIKPLADRVLVKESQKAKNETKSGIIIPDTVEEDKGAHKGEVVAVGSGKYDDGVLVPMSVKVGDEVLFQWGDKIKIDGVEYWIVNESNILAVVK